MKKLRQIEIKDSVEIREAEDGKQTLVGLIPYNSRSADMGFTEIITDTAFSKTLADGADVKALYAHDSTKPLGRVKNGTLRLRSEPNGLVCECDLPDTSYARDVYALIRDGYVTTMSFGFYPVKERIEKEGDRDVCYLLEVRLSEVSFAVVFPAYEATDSQAREVRGINVDALADILAKPELSTEDRNVLGNINTQISALIEPSKGPDTVAVPDTTAADFLASLHAAAMHKEK
jgi:HK97 family phage prohead protease